MADDRIHEQKIDLPLHKEDDMQPHVDALTRKLFEDASPSVVKVLTNDGAGSGVIVSAQGEIATDAHVVLNSAWVEVETKNGKVLPAKIEKMDDVRDVAILKVVGDLPSDTKVATLATDVKLKPDDPVWALGHPRGLSGIYISPGYFRHDGTAADIFDAQGDDMEKKRKDMLQAMTPLERQDAEASLGRKLALTKMHTEPGNSGGPVIDATGNVIGLGDLAGGKIWSNSDISPISYVTELLNADSKFQFCYKFVPKGDQKGSKSETGDYVLIDQRRTDGNYRSPYGDPFFNGDKDPKADGSRMHRHLDWRPELPQ